MEHNFYQPINGEITDIIIESPTIKTFVVKTEKPFNFDTGQFVELTLPGEGEAPTTETRSPGSCQPLPPAVGRAACPTPSASSLALRVARGFATAPRSTTAANAKACQLRKLSPLQLSPRPRRRRSRCAADTIRQTWSRRRWMPVEDAVWVRRPSLARGPPIR